MSDDGRLRRWEAIVLAAGASSRMGFHKAFLNWQGRPLLVHQVNELLATRVRRIVVVLGSQAERVSALLQHALDFERDARPGPVERVQIVVNPTWHEGKSSSIRVGAAALTAEATDLLLLTVDQPIRAEVVEALMGAHERTGKDATLPSGGGRRGHPIALSTRHLAGLASVSEEEQGVRALIRRIENEGGLALYEMAAPCIFWNFNRPQDAMIRQERVNVRPVVLGRKLPSSGKSKNDWEVLE